MNRVKYFFIFLELLIALSLKAEVLVILRQPPPYQFKINYLWNVSLINQDSAVNVYLFGKVILGGTDSILVDATTNYFDLPRGPKNVNASEISPISVDKHGNNEIENLLNKTGTFSSGSYKICIEVRDSETNAVLGSDCISIEIINMTKMDLLFPEDESNVFNLLPSFSWLPFAPVTAETGIISYQFQMVEMLNLQTKEYAFSSNPIYFYSNYLRTTIFQLPSAAKQLINGRKYAWKIVVYVNNDFLTESPVREFTYNGDYRNSKVLNDSIQEDLRKDLPPPPPKPKKPVSYDGSEASGKYESSKSIMRLQDELPLPKSITTSVKYEYNDKQAVNSELPKNFGSINIDIEGAPFNVNLYFDTQDQELKQSINSLGLILDKTKLKDNLGLGSNGKTGGSHKQDKSSDGPLAKFFSFFDEFGLGDTYPDYTPATVNGVKMTGANLSINPGLFYFAISGLNNLSPIPDSTYARKMIAGRIGVGGKDKSHFHFILMNAWDNPNSTTVNPTIVGITPQNNVVFGANGEYNFLQDQLKIKGEVNVATLTRDLNSPEFDESSLPGFVKSLPTFVKNLIDLNSSTQYDFYYEVSSIYASNTIGTKAELSFKSVGPGYISLAAPNIRQDLQTINFKVSNPFLKKQIQAAVFFKLEKNNLSDLNASTSTSKGFGINLKVNVKGYPYLLLDYRPSSISNDAIADSLSFVNNSNVFSLTSGMNLNSKTFINSIILVFNNISSSSNSQFGDYNILNLNLSNSLSLIKTPLTVSGSIGYNRNKDTAAYNAFLFDLSAAYTFFQKWNNSFGYSIYTMQNSNTKSTLYFNSSYPIGKFLNLNLNLSQDFYSEDVYQYGNVNNFILRAGITSDLR